MEQDNKGWDLEAVHPSLTTCLKIEVKGLSAPDLCVEVTSNEYARMAEHREVYRLCVVTSSLTAPRLAVFSYSAEARSWVDNEGRVLEIQEIDRSGR